MTDLTMCAGHGCPLRETCWRYRAPAGAWQSWAAWPRLPDGSCEAYTPIREETRE
jgi:hypothetical protein